MVELLVILGAVSVVASVGVVAVNSVRESAAENKLEADVNTLNNALRLYEATGGTIPSDAADDAILQLLKLPANMSTAQGKVSLSGSLIDPRTGIDRAASGDSALRAKWDASAKRFVTKAGDDTYTIKSFNLSGGSAGGVRPETAPAFVATDLTSPGQKWVWDFPESENLPTTQRGNSYAPSISAGMQAALSHGFQGGFWGVGETGVVTSSYVYDGAGYNGQLGLFSLAGMDSDTYDLTTAAGLEAFLREAVRRVLAGGSEGQVMVDTNKGTGREVVAHFNPGDAVAAILIPNGTFSQANFTNDESNLYPLLSLSFPTGDADGFYASQMVSLGNDGYAFEDMAGGGDQDYEDIIFTANGLEQPDWSTTHEVDPYTYYTEVRKNKYWDKPNTTDSSMSPFSIKDALTAAGIIE
jgi:hypothetical protein